MDLTLNNAVMGVELSGIRQFTYLVRDTPGACALTIGEPDLNTPDAIKEAAKAALDANDTHYPPGNGYPYLLEEISKFEAQAHGLHYAPSEIIMTVGATEALFASFSTILNAGDEVIIPPRTKAIILTSPNNPTGCMYSKETLDGIHDVLKDKPIFVLCDDVYRTLVYQEGYHSFAEYQDMRDRIIVINSFSKPYAMTGCPPLFSGPASRRCTPPPTMWWRSSASAGTMCTSVWWIWGWRSRSRRALSICSSISRSTGWIPRRSARRCSKRAWWA